MDIVTPLDVPNLVPDSWDIFWDIWNKNSANLVKTRYIPGNTNLRPIANTSELGRNNVWCGLDIYQTPLAEYKTLWKAPYVDIKQLLPNMYQQCLNLPFEKITCVRIVKSLLNVYQHSDDGRDQWLIRGMLYHPWEETQWYFSLPNNNNLLPLNLPKETHWFSYNDKYCHHGTKFIPDKQKLLIMVNAELPADLLLRSKEKYKNYVLTEEHFLKV